MRILIANDTYPPDINESAYFTRRLAEGLAQREYEVHVMSASTSRRTTVVARLCRARSLLISKTTNKSIL